MTNLANSFLKAQLSSDYEKAMSEHGYLFLAGILDKEKVKALKQKIEEIYENKEIGFDRVRAGEILFDQADQARLEIFKAVHQFPEFHDIGRTSQLLKVLKQLLGRQILKHQSTIFRATYTTVMSS